MFSYVFSTHLNADDVRDVVADVHGAVRFEHCQCHLRGEGRVKVGQK